MNAREFFYSVAEMRECQKAYFRSRDQLTLRAALTQSAVARRWGVSRFTIMRAEAGRTITWEMAYRLFNQLSHELENEVHNNN